MEAGGGRIGGTVVDDDYVIKVIAQGGDDIAYYRRFIIRSNHHEDSAIGRLVRPRVFLGITEIHNLPDILRGQRTISKLGASLFINFFLIRRQWHSELARVMNLVNLKNYRILVFFSERESRVSPEAEV